MFQKLTMIVSFKVSAPLVKLFYKNNGCALVDLQKFRTLKDMKSGVGSITAESVKDYSKIQRLFWCAI